MTFGDVWAEYGDVKVKIPESLEQQVIVVHAMERAEMSDKRESRVQSIKARTRKVEILQLRLRRLEQDADPSPLTLAECSCLRARIDQILNRALYGGDRGRVLAKDRSYHAGTLWA